MTLMIWFIRHGESESNAGLPTAESASTPLTPRGVEQSERVAQVFQESPKLVVVSHYLRSRQSAEPTLRRFPEVACAVWPVQEFTFLDRPAGLPLTNQQGNPLVEAFWHRCDPHWSEGGQAESFADLMARIQQVQHLLKEQEAGFIAIFSHGLFMRALYWCLLTGSFKISQARMKRFFHLRASFPVPNTAIMRLALQGDEVWMSPLITAHLADHETHQQSISQLEE